MKNLVTGVTVILYDNAELARLEGAISLPMETRVNVSDTDYIVHNLRLQLRETDFDFYYDTHLAERVGSQPEPI